MVGSAGAAARAQCRLAEIAELPVVVQRGRILIPSEINGQKALFILDTGASHSLLFTEAARRFAVPSHNVTTAAVGQLYGIGGEIDLRWADIADLKLGPLDMPHAQIRVGGDHAMGPDEIAGLIGYDVLERYDLEFDLAHARVRFLRSPGCSDDQMDYWRAPYGVASMNPHGGEDRRSYVRVQLNGASLDALLDTGAPRSTVTLGGAARAGVRPSTPGVVKLGELGGVSGDRMPLWAAPFHLFAIGEEKISNPTLTMADMFSRTLTTTTGSMVATQVEGPQMLLGLDFVLAHRLIVSREHDKVYFSYNGGPIFEPPRLRQPQAATAPAPPASTPADPG